MKKAYFLTPKLQGRKNEYLYTLLSITMNKLARLVGWNNERGGKFLKKLWCFVGEGYYETLCFYQLS